MTELQDLSRRRRGSCTRWLEYLAATVFLVGTANGFGCRFVDHEHGQASKPFLQQTGNPVAAQQLALQALANTQFVAIMLKRLSRVPMKRSAWAIVRPQAEPSARLPFDRKRMAPDRSTTFQDLTAKA